MANKHSIHTKPVAPIIYAVDAQYNHEAKRDVLAYGTVARTVMQDANGHAMHIVYVIKNRAGAEVNVDADSVDALIAALQQARKQDQL